MHKLFFLLILTSSQNGLARNSNQRIELDKLLLRRNSSAYCTFVRRVKSPNNLALPGQTAVTTVQLRSWDRSAMLNCLLKKFSSKKLVRQVNDEGLAPIHIAVRNDNADEVRLLLRHGADSCAISKKNKNGDYSFMAPIEIAIKRAARLEIFEMLLVKSCRTKNPLLHQVVAKGRPKVLDLLKINRTDLTSRDLKNRTALGANASACFGNVEKCLKCAAKLILMGSPIDKPQGDHGFSELVYAVHHNKWQLINLLIKNGASSNFRDSDGKTPLMHIYWQSPFEGWHSLDVEDRLHKILVKSGANESLRDNTGRKASDYKAEHRNDILRRKKLKRYKKPFEGFGSCFKFKVLPCIY
jgi:ankyrin repeat protein